MRQMAPMTSSPAKQVVRRVLHASVLAATIAAISTAATPAKANLAQEQAGVSAAVTGDVTLAKAAGGVGVLVESGMPVYLGDRITTSNNSGMQIMLLDETVFTIGPNSDVAIDEFVYDPATGDGKIVADMTKGVMRFVTGKIPLKNPSSMNVNLPVGSIGIRGTIGLIRSVTAEQVNQVMPGTVDTNGGNPPLLFMAVNQGPGLSRNDTTSRPGAFAVFNNTGNNQQVTGENFGVFVGSNLMTMPIRFPTNLATFDFSTSIIRNASRQPGSARNNTGSGASNGNTSPSGMNDDDMGQANEETGSAMAAGFNAAFQRGFLASNQRSENEASNFLNENSFGSNAMTFDALRQVTSGTASTGYITVTSGNFTYDFKSDINYQDRTIAIDFTYVGEIDSPTQGHAFLKEQYWDYNSSTGRVAYAGDQFSYTPNCRTMNCNASAVFTDAENVDFNITTDAAPKGAPSSATLSPESVSEPPPPPMQ